MLDIKLIRGNPEVVKKAVAAKKIKISVDEILALDQQKRSLDQQLQELQEGRRKIAETK